MSASKMNPLAVPSRCDDIFQLDNFVAHFTISILLAENGGLGTTERIVGVSFVRALEVFWNEFTDRIRFAEHEQPSTAILSWTIHVWILHLHVRHFRFTRRIHDYCDASRSLGTNILTPLRLNNLPNILKNDHLFYTFFMYTAPIGVTTS